ncbi:unnamed protein product [Durusdinium trenchii]|uniref:Phospholipase B-like n=1 Tax=Durusdinium trenchii TaxID=1381693 RepID=A0ABP0PCR9_9DINO
MLWTLLLLPCYSALRAFHSRDELRHAVLGWSYEARRHSYRQTYGDITGWDVSEVTDMHRLFYDLDDFNEDAQQQSLALGTCSVPGTTVTFACASETMPMTDWMLRVHTTPCTRHLALRAIHQNTNNSKHRAKRIKRFSGTVTKWLCG